ncbi:MAG: SAM-dependent methyltransferase, BioC-like [Devosia sp.]|nr:SAM-dependent methyltransferase, BioC-like [Devosia sp.]
MSAPRLFDREMIARRLAVAEAGADFVTPLVIGDLMERLGTVTRAFRQALILGPDAMLLPETGATATDPIAFTRVSTLVPRDGFALIDSEAVELPRTDYDLVVSLNDLHIVDDVPGHLAQLRAHMAADGLLLVGMPGGATLNELRESWLAADAELSGGASPRVAPFIELRDAGALLQRAGFALPVSDVETHTVRYSDMLGLLRDLKRLGASNPLVERPRQFARPALLALAAAHYQELAGDADGRVRATLEITWMSGWVPDASQQRPARRGSATVSLADVLGKRS